MTVMLGGVTSGIDRSLALNFRLPDMVRRPAPSVVPKILEYPPRTCGREGPRPDRQELRVDYEVVRRFRASQDKTNSSGIERTHAACSPIDAGEHAVIVPLSHLYGSYASDIACLS